jgi:hypothetical protein
MYCIHHTLLRVQLRWVQRRFPRRFFQHIPSQVQRRVRGFGN